MIARQAAAAWPAPREDGWPIVGGRSHMGLLAGVAAAHVAVIGLLLQLPPATTTMPPVQPVLHVEWVTPPARPAEPPPSIRKAPAEPAMARQQASADRTAPSMRNGAQAAATAAGSRAAGNPDIPGAAPPAAPPAVATMPPSSAPERADAQRPGAHSPGSQAMASTTATASADAPLPAPSAAPATVPAQAPASTSADTVHATRASGLESGPAAPLAGSPGATGATLRDGTARGRTAARGGAVPTISDSIVGYVHRPQPVFPPLSRRLGESGRVALRVQIDTAGRPTDVAIVASSGYPRLDDAATQAARRALFRPFLEAGEPRTVWVSVAIVFALEES